jgi:hypothetical protein
MSSASLLDLSIQLLNPFAVEPALVENLVHLRIKRMRRRSGDFCRRHPQLALLRFPPAHRHAYLEVSNILDITRFGGLLTAVNIGWWVSHLPPE